jgi:hypothetical protein
MRRAAVVCAIYVAAAVVLTWPLAIKLTSHLGALQGPGDPFLNVWILGWGLRAWTMDPTSVWSGRVFDANIFYPAEGALTYSDHFLLQSLALAPVYAVTHDAVLCYNLLLIGSIALSGLAMHAFANAVTGSRPAAFVAGLAWACWPYRTAHLLHIQLQALYLMPLALLCLHRVVAKRRWRDAIALAAATAGQAIASVYYGLMTVLAIVVASGVLATATGQWRARRLWSRLIAAGALTLAIAAPVLVPYARSQQAEGFGRTLFEASNHSAALRSYAQVPPANLLYGRSGALAARAPAGGARDRTGVEHQLFPGVVLVGLAVFALARNVRSDSRPLALSSLALVVVGVLLSLGPEGWRAVYAVLHDNVYGFQAIRAPARFAVIAMIGAATLAALGMRDILRRFGRAVPQSAPGSGAEGSLMESPASVRPIAAIVIALLCLEYLNAPLPLAVAPPRHTPVGQWLAHEPTPGAVLHVPLGDDIDNTPFMVQSLEHGRPIVNGYSGQRPAFFSSLVDSLADFPSPVALATLREVDVRFVVSAAPLAGAGSASSPLVERARLSGGTIYEVRWTPDAIAALDEVKAPPPPPPGVPPFAEGETAVYDVYWDGGPVNLPAGTARLTVREGQRATDHWRFEARAVTASWVATFFQANDVLITTADRALLPLEHTREIREGRRRLDRAFIYDRNARNIRIGDSLDAARAADALTLPLGAEGARDALTALYYVRSLPLVSGMVLTVPINEGGASLVLQVAVAEAATIEHGGLMTPTIRLEPRMMRRIERRRPISMTIWLSTDDRRVPLRFVIEAGFGRIRAELADYRQ